MNHPLLVAATVLGIVGTLFIMIGMSTPGWITAPEYGLGLFVQCIQNVCVSYEASGAFAAVRAFLTIGFLCSLAGTVIILVHFCKNVRQDVTNRLLPLIASILYFVGAGLALLGAIIFAAKASDLRGNLGYSFALAIVGSLAGLAAGALIMVQRSKTG